MSLLPSQPLAEKRVDESVVPVKPVGKFLLFDFGDCLPYGGCAVDICGVAESCGIRLLPSYFGDGFKNARLQRSELLYKKRKVFTFLMDEMNACFLLARFRYLVYTISRAL